MASKKKAAKSKIIEVEEGPANNKPDEPKGSHALAITTAQSTPFKVLIETLNGLLNDVNFHFTRNGIFVRSSNAPINNFVVNLEMYRKNFEKYDFYSDKDDIVKGIKLSTFYKFIKNIGSSYILSLVIDDESSYELIIRMENMDKGKFHNYRMSILDLNINDLVPIEPHLYPIVISLPSNEFQKTLREVISWTTQFEIKVIPVNHLIFSYHGDGGKLDINYRQKVGCMSVMRNEKEDEIIQGVYNVESINSFAKCSSISSVVKLYLSNDLPLMIEYDVGNLGVIQLCTPSIPLLEK